MHISCTKAYGQLPHTLLYFFPSFASAYPPSAYPPAPETRNSPRLVASSSSVVSTDRAAIRTYRTTDPRMKQFFTAICQGASRQHLLDREETFQEGGAGRGEQQEAGSIHRPLKIIFPLKIQTNNGPPPQLCHLFTVWNPTFTFGNRRKKRIYTLTI